MINELLAIDFGDSKTGVARMNLSAKIPEPLPLLTEQGKPLLRKISDIVKEQGSELVLIGLPVGLNSGNDTDQTAKIRSFAADLASSLSVPVEFVDEALSTVEAEKWTMRYPEASEDSLAACIILERYPGAQETQNAV